MLTPEDIFWKSRSGTCWRGELKLALTINHDARESAGDSVMATENISWDSFWDLGSPSDLAALMLEIYGSGAANAASECMASATADNREDDCRFWIAVKAIIVAALQKSKTPSPASA